MGRNEIVLKEKLYIDVVVANFATTGLLCNLHFLQNGYEPCNKLSLKINESK